MGKEDKQKDLSYFAQLIAENHGISIEASSLFVKDFFQIIEKGLLKDNYVHIKGLGTFKRMSLGSESKSFQRESINKLVFVPDVDLKSLINKHFEHFEPVVVSSDYLKKQWLDDKKDEIEDKRKAMAKKEISISEKEQVGEMKKIKNIGEEQQKIEKNKGCNLQNKRALGKEVRVEEPFISIYGKANDKNTQNTAQGAVIDNTSKVKIDDKGKKMKTKNNSIWMLSFVILILSVLVLLLVFRLMSVQKELNAYVRLRTEAKALEAIKRDGNIVLYPEVDASIDSLVGNESGFIDEEEKIDNTSQRISLTDQYQIPSRSSLPYTIKGVKTTHQVVPGETLRILAEVYYGSRDMWVYIYYYNETIIKSPNQIPKNITLRIPELEYKRK